MSSEVCFLHYCNAMQTLAETKHSKSFVLHLPNFFFIETVFTNFQAPNQTFKQNLD